MLLTDFEDRKRVEEKLQRSEAFLTQAQSISHTGSFGWRVSTGEILWSDETFRIFQYERTTTPTVDLILQRVHPEDAALVRQTIERASQDGKDFDFEHRLLMPDSSIKHVRVVGHADRDQSGELEFVGAVMDVTAAKDAEERIRQDERELRITIETIPAIVSCARPDGTVDFISHKWLDYIGRSREEIVGAWQSTIHPEDLDRVLNSWQAALATGEPLEMETRYRRADGTYRWFLVRAAPLRDDKGNIVKWYATVFDIEDRKRAEEKLREAQADLAHVSRVTTLGEMAASIAHEVDQPLSGVVINAKACLRFLTGAAPNLDEVRDGLQAIARDGRRASDVIARIRALARRTVTEKGPLDINEVIREVVALAEGAVRRMGARLRTELAGDLPRVLGDRVELQQVVLNLLLNGLDAMHAVAGSPRELVVSTQREARNRVRVAVQDTGCGIDPQLAERIFEAFYTTKRDGLGMGLLISRSIVEQHGGRLWAAPNDGPGTTFYFTV